MGYDNPICHRESRFIGMMRSPEIGGIASPDIIRDRNDNRDGYEILVSVNKNDRSTLRKYESSAKFLLLIRPAVDTRCSGLHMKPAFRAVPFPRFKIGIGILFPVAAGDQYGYSDDADNEQEKCYEV